MYDQFSPKAEGKKIKISLETGLEDADALILTDSTKLIQIISNLISNAIKFTENGEIRIKYYLKDNFLEFNVSDTGIGIPKEYHARIFDRFYQVHSNDTRLYEGTGLGLAISRAYVDLLGGMMWLSSEPGKGSSFFFTIPYETSKVDNKEEVEINSTSTFAFSSKKTILIAEDVDSNFKLISFFLSKANTRIIRAVNGREAVEKALSGEKIDLILMDIKMPVMDGYTATKIIRESDPFIPIIAQTAYSEDRNKSIDYGCSGFISKPFDKKSLFRILKEYI
ncbi:MAG: response regulator [Bacteroidetes bacterium]|nr:response regulator [Bacteroidota bacterium]